ncbi:C39 family peptidase [Paenibacillus kobensis]|uniref:C39 family peptidase n=1 Tax=Paenibacillus kobensis TaxID=59841 RepID=UPI0013E3BA1F|nr:C39 family peptidase [Paenibacillus kobensis]
MPDNNAMPQIPEEVLGLDPAAAKAAVKQLQDRLNALGYTGAAGAALVADGKFGANTLFAVNAFKKANQLGNAGASEGKIGPQSWKVLFAPGAKRADGSEDRGQPTPAPTDREPVYYSQEDPRWKTVLYSNRQDRSQTIATSGCGPTCMAMAITTLTGNKVEPPATCKFALDNGFRTDDNGTAWGFFGRIASVYGLKCSQTSDWNDVRAALSQPGPIVIASMRPGHFTGGGHYILLHNILKKNGEWWIDVLDPNIDNTRYTHYGNDRLIDEGVKNDGRVTAKESLFTSEAGQFWIISK